MIIKHAFIAGLAVAVVSCSKPLPVETDAMAPTITRGNLVSIKASNAKPQRFEIVAINQPHASGRTSIMRVVGLPGETVQLGPDGVMINGMHLQNLPAQLNYRTPLRKVYVYGVHAPYKLGSGEYFVLGDNIDDAVDSRIYGPIKDSSIRGFVEVQNDKVK